MDGTTLEIQIDERRPQCLQMSSTKVQKRMRKASRSKGRNAEFSAIAITPAAVQPTEFHSGEELSAEQRENFRSLIYNDFPEILHPINSPPISRQWDYPIDTTSPMKRQRLKILSPAERAELNRQLTDAMDVGLIRPIYREFGSPILFVRKADGSLR
jgi:hypothetical protein